MVTAPQSRFQTLTGRALELQRTPSNGGWPGYEPWFREIILQLPHNVAKRTSWFSSWKRWRRLQAQNGSLAPRAHGGGAPRRMTVVEHALLHAYKIANSHATGDECRIFLALYCGRVHTRSLISTYLHNALNMSRQRLQTIPSEQDPYRVMLWHTQAPPVGHAGVPRANLINIDEMGISLLKCRRTTGHAVVGTRAVAHQRSNPGVRFNLIAGVSSTGELFFTINDENTDAATFLAFLQNDVFPFIAGTSRHLMWDNLRVHLTLPITMACHAQGHVPLPCAPYNPDESPIEYFFGEVEKYLRLKNYELTEANFRAEVHAACVNVAATMDLDAVFRHCRL